MLLTIALIFLVGLLVSELFNHYKIPGLIGLILVGMIVGPYGLGLLDQTTQLISLELRQVALVIILLRVGLQIDLSDLRIVGKSALKLSFVPALFEVVGVTIVAHFLFGWTIYEALLLASILAAVSPAVVVPRMLQLIQKGIGKEKRIPELITAGASLDDVFVIVLFASALQMAQTQTLSLSLFIQVPISILTGLILGGVVGLCLVQLFKRVHLRDSSKVLILLGVSAFWVYISDRMPFQIPFSGFIAVIASGAMILRFYPLLAKRLVVKFEKVWVMAELILFVLVGAAVDLSVIPTIGVSALVIVLLGLTTRSIGTLVSITPSNLTPKEKGFVVFSYLPKATVQAAIGSIPLAYGIQSGNAMLAISVLAIILTAPLGAFLIDHTSHWLQIKPQTSTNLVKNEHL